MKSILTLCISIAVALAAVAAPVPAERAREGAATPTPSTPAPAPAVPASKPAGQAAAAKGSELAALEKKLLGAWRGAACAGDYTFKADGTFECIHFTPGDNTLTGTWSIRWDALPPTLILVCKTSDFKQRAPNWPEYEYLNKPREIKLLKLDDEAFSYQFPGDTFEWRNSRPDKE